MQPFDKKSTWQKALINLITSPEVLLNKLNLEKEKYLIPAQNASKLFGLRVTESFVSRMKIGDPLDPLLLQVLPLQAELESVEGYSSDPLMESVYNPVSGLLHKYANRVLINLISQCAINCRYCFRREFPYEKNNPGKQGWKKILDYIISHPTINEIILSGADPLSAPDRHLEEFGKFILELSQIKTLRIHTRLPIVLPERITPEFCAWLKTYPLQKVIVLHTNHPNEINDEVKSAVALLKNCNVTLLNHTVLLKKINDSAETLIALNHALFSMGVLPYYLHLLDKVRGTAHFDVSETLAKQLLKTLQETLPGYLVPKLVREVPGEKHKIMVS